MGMEGKVVLSLSPVGAEPDPGGRQGWKAPGAAARVGAGAGEGRLCTPRLSSGSSRCRGQDVALEGPCSPRAGQKLFPPSQLGTGGDEMGLSSVRGWWGWEGVVCVWLGGMARAARIPPGALGD